MSNGNDPQLPQDDNNLGPERSLRVVKADQPDPMSEIDRVVLASMPDPAPSSYRGNLIALLLMGAALLLIKLLSQQAGHSPDARAIPATDIEAAAPHLAKLRIP
ncbi:MAG TPA: hypothetical protein VFV47_08685 [Hyphomicrobiaceae bacterium]|nr:hypothetical protein [Hyphomicrobiaceae bacterium]